MATTVALAALPDDAVADVLRALPMQNLAVARCVCKAWRHIIDDRALLHPYLCPRTVRGVFINYIDHRRPHHFARPTSSSTVPRVDGMLSFLPNNSRTDAWSVLDHCSGLLLCNIWWGSTLCVCNPATRRWTELPPGAGDIKYHGYNGAYIAFDPAVSPHYKVIFIPDVPEKPPLPKRQDLRKERWMLPKDAPLCLDRLFSLSPDDEDDVISAIEEEEFEEQLPFMDDENLEHDIDDDPCRLMEWPPSPWTLCVFSSRTGHWEEQSFVSESMPAGTVEQMRRDPERPTIRGPRRRYAIYHHGSLYVHCRGSFVTRLSLSNGKYQIIQAPANMKYAKPYLGKLQNSVCFGIVHEDQLKIWILNEACGKMEWVMKCKVEVGMYAQYIGSMPYSNNGRQPDGSWIVQEDNTDMRYTDDDVETLSEKSYEWDSDDDDTFTIDIESPEYYYSSKGLNVIGFHPFKEVVFMVEWFGVVAYHLNSSKIQHLGNSRPKCYYRNHSNGIYESFVYTPCMIGELVHGDETGKSSCEED